MNVLAQLEAALAAAEARYAQAEARVLEARDRGVDTSTVQAGSATTPDHTLRFLAARVDTLKRELDRYVSATDPKPHCVPCPTTQVKAAADAFAKRFPVTVNGIPAGLHWVRPADLVLPRMAPVRGHFGSRRSDGTLWLIWARESALGSAVHLTTVARGHHQRYPLAATPAEGLAYLEWQAYGGSLGGAGARNMLGWAHRVLDLNGGCTSATGVDQAEGATKVWRCDTCGWRHRAVTKDGITTYVGLR